MIATLALAAILLDCGLVQSQASLLGGSSGSSSVYDLMKSITGFTDADVNALVATGLDNINKLHMSNPSLAWKIRQFNVNYDKTAARPPERHFLDKPSTRLYFKPELYRMQQSQVNVPSAEQTGIVPIPVNAQQKLLHTYLFSKTQEKLTMLVL
ncbi:hypothetical protein OESDEN_03367 [Oesophagostomum dentatum]|uniref:Uncharacterized protein n=1 Tax=Oesophagostomum dentatum TaxID=61180 RepID=A0A0B1TLJ9_OESDE|nr:hypothetical protein OESDEN_03367 [Oesophagostomum dentatum]